MSRERHQHRLNSVRDWDAPLDGETLHHCAIRAETGPQRRGEYSHQHLRREFFSEAESGELGGNSIVRRGSTLPCRLWVKS